jgi:hypothetical protein
MLKNLDQRKQAKMQWLQDPNQSNLDNCNSVRREARSQCRDKKKEYLKGKLMNLKLTVGTKILGTCIGASLTLSLQLI